MINVKRSYVTPSYSAGFVSRVQHASKRMLSQHPLNYGICRFMTLNRTVSALAVNTVQNCQTKQQCNRTYIVLVWVHDPIPDMER